MFASFKTFAELCVVTLAAYFLAGAAFEVLRSDPPAGHGGQPAVVAPAPAPVKREPLRAYASIGKRNLFGAQLERPKPKKAEPKPKPEPVKETITELPVTSKLTLLGTVFSGDGAQRRAVVQSGNKQKMYSEGDKVSGYLIQDIQRRAVVVESKNRKEVILIDTDDATVADKSSDLRPLSRKTLGEYFRDLAQVADDIRINPVSKGKRKGLGVALLREGSPMHQAGLRIRDILLSANGQALREPTDLMRIEDMLGENRITLEVLRDDAPITLNLEIVN